MIDRNCVIIWIDVVCEPVVVSPVPCDSNSDELGPPKDGAEIRRQCAAIVEVVVERAGEVLLVGAGRRRHRRRYWR